VPLGGRLLIGHHIAHGRARFFLEREFGEKANSTPG
jgi:hypothetical protein